MQTQTDIPPELTLKDRCDRCPAQAKVLTKMKKGGKLQWCSHHYNEVKHMLKGLVLHTADERDDDS